MRVTVFLPSLAGGGAERSILMVTNGLVARGVDVDLVLAAAEGPFLADVANRVNVVDLQHNSVLLALPGLVRHLRTARPDGLLAAMGHASVVAVIAHRLAGSRARLVLSERAHLSSVLQEHYGLRMQLTWLLMRWTYPLADRIVAVSEGVANDLAEYFLTTRDRIETIYNPVVDASLEAKAAEPSLHPWLCQHDTPVVLAAGRLIGQKDFATLIRAFALVRHRRPARLMILGEGELRASLIALAAELGVSADIDMPGFVVNPFSAMRAADVFVLSSRFEGLPGVLIQAMACGTRVVSTDCPSGPREVLESGRWGRLVPVGDSLALASAIEAALDDPHPPDVRARAAVFSTEVAVNHYARVLGVNRQEVVS